MPDLTNDEDLRTALRDIAAWGEPGTVLAVPHPAVALPPSDPPRRSWTRPVAGAAAALLLFVLAVAVSANRETTDVPLADGTWADMAPSPLSPRAGATVVWTGTEMLVVGGDPGGDPDAFIPGAAYDPASDSWREMAPPPGGRVALGVWTEEEAVYVVYPSGQPSMQSDYDLVAYDPVTDTWRVVLEARFDPDPPTDALVPLGPVPIEVPEALELADGEVIIVGWQSTQSQYAWTTLDVDLGTWDEPTRLGPDSNDIYFSDKATAVVDGSLLFLKAHWLAAGLAGYWITPRTGEWVAITAPGEREGVAGADVQLGSLGGRAVAIGVVTNGEGRSARRAWRLAPGSNEWQDAPAPPDGPTADQPQAVSVLSTPDGLVVLGGHDLGEGITEGGLGTRGGLHVASNDELGRWADLPDPPIDLNRVDASAVWTGTEVLIWGGASDGMGAFSDGARYWPYG